MTLLLRRTAPADAEPTSPVLAPAHPRPAPRRTNAAPEANRGCGDA